MVIIMSTARPPIALRRGHDRKIAGVCSGLAEAGGIDPWIVRIGFIMLMVAGGIGLPLYIVLAVAMPDSDAPAGTGLQWDLHLREFRQPVGLMLIVGGTLLLVRNLGPNIPVGAIIGPTLGVGGIALGYLHTGERERTLVRGAAARIGSESAIRLVLGGALVLAGLATMFVSGDGFSLLRQVVLAAGVTIAGLGLILYPWVRGLLRDLSEERRERIRSEERAEVAAHVHDSVLQTLALIQRNADKPRELVALARRQERELRSWLYGDRTRDSGATLASEMTAMAADVEERHGIEVDVVTVGDCPLDGRLDALVQAAREAAVNAAKHSGASEVSVYVEVEPEKVSVFVRDRGKGFDPSAVSDDRKGISESIDARMVRHGGSAQITSTPGEGTEVALEIPLETVP
jgi:signal transduction histidine kinase/phage shock protein PspC (stress-responsive transcriptional regulator)